jgi:UDP-N-acetylmuramoyl-L-alanyl-D-glutamate--2,6-diaminopimelate ligase
MLKHVTLNQILKSIRNGEWTGVSTNTKKIQEGNLFLAIKGARIDRHNFLDEAFYEGATSAVVSKKWYESHKKLVERTLDDPEKFGDREYLIVDDTNAIEARLFQEFYDNPQDKIFLIGVTGTDGKTTTSHMVQKLLGEEVCGYIGTNGISFGKDVPEKLATAGKNFSKKNSFNTSTITEELNKISDVKSTVKESESDGTGGSSNGGGSDGAGASNGGGSGSSSGADGSSDGIKKYANSKTSYFADSFNTTPGPDELYLHFDEMQKRGAKYIVIEASSEAEYYNRLNDLKFDILALTNITSEHLNTHKTVEEYRKSKIRILTDHIKSTGHLVLNSDDENTAVIKKLLEKHGHKESRVLTFGSHPADNMSIVGHASTGKSTFVRLKHREITYNFISPLLGDFNVENLSCALEIALITHIFGGGPDAGTGAGVGASMSGAGRSGTGSGASKSGSGRSGAGDFGTGNIMALLARVPEIKVPGRMMFYEDSRGFTVILDYAHTVNGVTRYMENLGELYYSNINESQNTELKLITVIGQAGERDKDKRPVVGRIVAQNSHIAIFTSEDPKNEPITDIISDMKSDIIEDENDSRADGTKFEILEIHSRADAIAKAFELAVEAGDGSIISVLGKGTEDFEKIGDEKIHYNDEEEIRKHLK